MKDIDLTQVRPEYISQLSREEFEMALAKVYTVFQEDRKENALFYYKPASEKSEETHLSDVLVTTIFGGNRCLPLHAPVLMANGTWKPLGSVQPGDLVTAADPETRQSAHARVRRVYRSGRRPVYRIRFSDGGSFEATADHHVPLFLGSGAWTTKNRPKHPKKRRLGDYLEPIARRGSANPSKRISAVSPKDIRAAIDPKFCMHPYLLGALLGDGSFTKRPTVAFHNVDEAVIDRVRHHVESLGLELIKYKHGCEYGIRGVFAGHPFRIDCDRLELWCRDWYKKIPEECFGLDRAGRMELLAGLMDTDGTKNYFCSASENLSRGVARLVRSLGGKATVSERKSPSRRGKAYGVYMRLNERIPLSRPDKQIPDVARMVDYSRRVCRDALYVGMHECGDLEVDHPAHCYVTGDYVIVSNSAKTETNLMHGVMHATGVIPEYLRKKYPGHFERRMRGPCNGRIVCQSLVNVLEMTILPKLRWSSWSGSDDVGGEKGHWGWIPRNCLIDGEWDRSYSAKSRSLRLLCRDPENIDRIIGESMIQFFSYDQKAEDFASAHLHWVIFDEPPPLPIYNENKIRVMSASGWIRVGMTWPDDPAINVDWIYEELYEKGSPGPNKDPNYECFQLHTTDNQHLNQEAVAQHMQTMSMREKKVRIYGEQVRFSNRVHEFFTEDEKVWCFGCGQDVMGTEEECFSCGSSDVVRYSHKEDFEWPRGWPVLWVVDPHPRKPHMSAWIGVSPADEYFWVAEFECKGDPTQMRIGVDRVESELGLRTMRRLMDPRMGGSPSGAQRDRTWLDEFEAAGLACEPAQPGEVGRTLLDQWMQPDPMSRRPRMRWHPRCSGAIYQFKRFMWQDWKIGAEKGQRQKPRDVNDDYPAIGRYFANEEPTYTQLIYGARPIQTPVYAQRGNMGHSAPAIHPYLRR